MILLVVPAWSQISYTGTSGTCYLMPANFSLTLHGRTTPVRVEIEILGTDIQYYKQNRTYTSWQSDTIVLDPEPNFIWASNWAVQLYQITSAD